MFYPDSFKVSTPSDHEIQVSRDLSVLRRIGPQFLKTFPPRVPSCLTAPQRALTGGRLSSCPA
jgi:hypothetical protein